MPFVVINQNDRIGTGLLFELSLREGFELVMSQIEGQGMTLFKYNLPRYYPDLDRLQTYIPFVYPTPSFTRTDELLETEILSQLSGFRVVRGLFENGRVAFYIESGEPLYIPEESQADYVEFLGELKGLYFATSSPLAKLVKGIKVKRHSECEIWATSSPGEALIIAEQISEMGTKGIFVVENPPENAESFRKAFGYELIADWGSEIVLQGHEPFGASLWERELGGLRPGERPGGELGKTPEIGINIEYKAGEEVETLALYVSHYIHLLEMPPAQTFATPEIISDVHLLRLDPGKGQLVFRTPSKAFAEEMVKAPPKEFVIKAVDSPKEVIGARLSLSRSNLRSFLLITEGQTYLVIPNPLGQTAIINEALTHPLPEIAIRDALLSRVGNLREMKDPITLEPFMDLDTEDLANIVITPENYGYKISTFRGLKEDTITHHPFAPKTLAKAGWNLYGYFTEFPFLGLVDNPSYLQE